MKKFLFLTLIFGAVTSTAIHAQGSQQIAVQPAKEGTKAQSGDFAEMLKQAKEKQKPPMMEKNGTNGCAGRQGDRDQFRNTPESR